MAVDSQPKRKTSLEELLTLNVCVLFSKPLRTSLHVHRILEERDDENILPPPQTEISTAMRLESWNRGIVKWTRVIVDRIVALIDDRTTAHTHTYTYTHISSCLDGTKHRFSISDQYQEDRPRLESDQRTKTKCFPLGGISCWQTKVLLSMITCSRCVYSNFFQPAIRIRSE